MTATYGSRGVPDPTVWTGGRGEPGDTTAGGWKAPGLPKTTAEHPPSKPSTGGMMSSYALTPTKLMTPYNTEEFWELAEFTSKHLGTMSAQTETIAIDLRKLLANPEGTKMAWARADLKINALRVARPIAHAAKLEQSAAKSMRQAWMLYLRLYAEAPRKGHGRTFTVS